MTEEEREIALKAAEGRRPSYDARGNVRAFRSRAGAPQAARSSSGLGVAAPLGSAGHGSAWNNFFPRPDASTADSDPVSAAIAGNSAWMKSNGITFPPPPVAPDRSTGPSFRTIPNATQLLANDPARNKPAQPTAGYAANAWNFNRNLYAPTDTKPQPAPAPLSNGRPWPFPSIPSGRGDNTLTTRYGTASVNFNGAMNSAKALPASTRRWGRNYGV